MDYQSATVDAVSKIVLQFDLPAKELLVLMFIIGNDYIFGLINIIVNLSRVKILAFASIFSQILKKIINNICYLL